MHTNTHANCVHTVKPLHFNPNRNDEYVAPSKAKAISRLIRDLCSEVRWQGAFCFIGVESAFCARDTCF